MCDETTEQAHDAALARRGMTRREFAALGSAVALVGCAGGAGGAGAGEDLRERMVRITTQDGIADAFFVHPAKGRHPAVIMWPDIAGLRDAMKIMARQLAAANYAVLVVNPYYRSAPAPVMESFSEFLRPEGREMAMGYRALLTHEAITRDATAWVAFLDGDEAVDTARGIGSSGYCMGGPFTVRSAAAAPARVRAAASFHGGGLVSEETASPHTLIESTQAGFLFAIARDDDAKEPEHKAVLRKAADAAGRPAEIEVYSADHGWMVPDSPAWEPSAADKGFERMLALFSKL